MGPVVMRIQIQLGDYLRVLYSASLAAARLARSASAMRLSSRSRQLGRLAPGVLTAVQIAANRRLSRIRTSLAGARVARTRCAASNLVASGSLATSRSARPASSGLDSLTRSTFPNSVRAAHTASAASPSCAKAGRADEDGVPGGMVHTWEAVAGLTRPH